MTLKVKSNNKLKDALYFDLLLLFTFQAAAKEDDEKINSEETSATTAPK